MKKKLPSITIVIPAYNEASNIGNLLAKLAKQNQINFNLTLVQLILDGCTDSTEKIAKKYIQSLPQLQIKNDHLRLGKMSRIIEAYENLQSDYVLILDADINFSSPNFLRIIMDSFTSKKIGLVIPYVKVSQGKNFFQKIIVSYEHFWERLIDSMPKQNSIHHMGCAYAISKDAVKKIKLAKNIVADDFYLYCQIKQLKFEIKLAKKAKLTYKAPATFSDYLKQRKRYQQSADQLGDYVTLDLEKETYIPMELKIKAYFSTLLTDPIYFGLSLCLQFYYRTFNRNFEKLQPSWQTLTSTK